MDKLQRYDDMLYPQLIAMIGSKRQFLLVMIATVVKTERQGYVVGIVVKHGG